MRFDRVRVASFDTRIYFNGNNREQGTDSLPKSDYKFAQFSNKVGNSLAYSTDNKFLCFERQGQFLALLQMSRKIVETFRFLNLSFQCLFQEEFKFLKFSNYNYYSIIYIIFLNKFQKYAQDCFLYFISKTKLFFH